MKPRHIKMKLTSGLFYDSFKVGFPVSTSFIISQLRNGRIYIYKVGVITLVSTYLIDMIREHYTVVIIVIVWDCVW